MGETGIVRFPGSLDPRAQEFRPSNSKFNVNDFSPPHHQTPSFFGKPLQNVYYPYIPQTTPYGDVAGAGAGAPVPPVPVPLLGLGPPPPPCVRTVPPLLPPSAEPTRALLVSSVAGDVSETTVRRELEVFGEVRGVQMERLRDGIVTVHFYDLRHAEMALKEMREQHMLHQQSRMNNYFGSLQLSPPPPPACGLIAGGAVWAQFIIPACNAVPGGLNQGTIVVFNLDPNVSSSCLKEIFQAFGAVKELRETPMKKQQRFVEFYDVRDAAKALREMNGKEIYGNHVAIEFSRPGGYGGKFFNAITKGCYSTRSNNGFFNYKKISKYAPRPQLPLPPTPHSPPPLPLPPAQSAGKLSGKWLYNVPPNAFKSKANPKDDENVSQEETSIDETLSLSGGSVGDVIVEKIAADGAPKRNVRKGQLRQSSSATVKQQQPRSRQEKGKQLKKLDTRFLINADAVVESNCKNDSRTTLMIKNIPNKYSQKLLLNMLDNHCIHCNEQLIANGDDQPLSSYDFVYLPIDFNNKCNVGYGFVNMTSPQAAWRLYKAFHHHHWEVFNSRKICEVTYARVQGLEALKDHFKNSKFPCEMMDQDQYLPAVFTPPRDGRQLTEPFPIVGHRKQQMLIKFTDPDDGVDGGDSLKKDNRAADREEVEEEENLNCSSSCRNDGSWNGGDDEKDSIISDRM